MPEATRSNRFAYAFYATDNTYAIAVMVCVTLLRNAGASADFVLLHLPLSRFVMDKLQQMNIRTRLVAPVEQSPHWYFRDCLVKLRILQLTEYVRVIYLDADAIPLKNLDHLLTMRLDAPLAAPVAYWRSERLWTSFLLVVAPSEELWNRVIRRLQEAPRERRYDMTIINDEFGAEIQSLPPGLALLNSEWQDRDRVRSLEDPAGAFRNTAVIHFSALGKPWSYTPDRVRRLRPNAHPEFYRIFELWWETRGELLRDRLVSLQAADWLSRAARWRSHGLAYLKRKAASGLG